MLSDKAQGIHGLDHHLYTDYFPNVPKGLDAR